MREMPQCWADVENSNQLPSRWEIFREQPLIRESFASSFQIMSEKYFFSLFEQNKERVSLNYETFIAKHHDFNYIFLEFSIRKLIDLFEARLKESKNKKKVF